ncbi:hypothetical protein Pint_33168 [Pistacia integerrima]|uniref:Uncharacterized protein n=1 Tax=Pistacia integerrima TaxID=434235 RepID=A0ACC0X596_9ROSI|nr:hypothetical protein Pint_33168 [Pistacia integerrima]
MHLRCSEYHELSVALMKVLVLVEVVELTGVSVEIGLRAVMGEGGSGILFICFELESGLIKFLWQWPSVIADGSDVGDCHNYDGGARALSDGSLNSELGNQAKTHGNSHSKTGAKVLIVLLAVVAVGLFSFFLFKLWQRKKREEQYARLLKLFEEDDELEVELGLRD